MEIAVKMALKRAGLASPPAGGSDDKDKDVAVVTLRDCYHGDTLGCMDLAAPTVFNQGQHPWYTPRALTLDPPTVAWARGQLRITLPPGGCAASMLTRSRQTNQSYRTLCEHQG
jgi:bifunctional dethiobiotin synthetase / adenosylmethionine---8-amino-7-oxononanoate aminotransferase